MKKQSSKITKSGKIHKSRSGKKATISENLPKTASHTSGTVKTRKFNVYSPTRHLSGRSSIPVRLVKKVLPDLVSGQNSTFPVTSKLLSKFAIIDELYAEKKSREVIKELIGNTGLSAKILAENIFEISLKTLYNYRRSEKPLPVRLNEQSIKIRELFIKGKEIFGSSDNFETWLNTESYGLNKKVPLYLLNSVTGIDLVYEELLRMEFGAPI